MRLIFARHGNTFGPDDRVVWVGAGTDLPLVEKGIAQAHAAARFLDDNDLRPTAVIAATLKRTQHFAKIVCDDLKLSPPRSDFRLNEIHYGAWEGAATEQIAADPARKQALEQWQQADIWPLALNWQTTQAQVTIALSSLLDELKAGAGGDSPLIVSSNGILRFAPRLLGVDSAASYQLKTGALGCADEDSGRWTVRFWGQGA